MSIYPTGYAYVHGIFALLLTFPAYILMKYVELRIRRQSDLA